MPLEPIQPHGLTLEFHDVIIRAAPRPGRPECLSRRLAPSNCPPPQAGEGNIHSKLSVYTDRVRIDSDQARTDAATPIRYYEDFHVGNVIDVGSVSVSQPEIIAFARQYDPQPMHTDPRAAEFTIYSGLIASGWHTVALFM